VLLLFSVTCYISHILLFHQGFENWIQNAILNDIGYYCTKITDISMLKNMKQTQWFSKYSFTPGISEWTMPTYELEEFNCVFRDEWVKNKTEKKLLNETFA